LPLRFMIPLRARRVLDRALAHRGFTADADIQVLARRITEASYTDTSVHITSQPSEQWLASYDYHGHHLSQAGRDLLVRHPRAGFAAIHCADNLVAIGRGAVDDRWLGVTAVYVEPSYRRQGLASAIVRNLWTWAAQEHGATHSYLQVVNTNAAALRLYDRLGYWRHHDYRYRTEPNAT
jgi:GNAT superfamily N-acetyltransferase